MKVDVYFLGTSSGIPTVKRNHPSILIYREGVHILFDCGEGTQRQLKKLRIPSTKIDYIFLSHWHADHSAGLYPLVRSMEQGERKEKLIIVGPEGTEEKFKSLHKIFGGKISFPIKFIELTIRDENNIISTEDFEIWSVKTKHSSDSFAFYFKEKDRTKINLEYTKKFGLSQHPLLGKLQKGEDIVYNGKTISHDKATFTVKGKKISYTGDAVLTKSLIDFCRKSDLLISESTYALSEESWRDETERMHMLSTDAAELAHASCSKKLYLTHFSQRYENNAKHLIDEARKVFKNTFEARDLKKISLS